MDLRQRWNIASQALMWERKAFPRPWPSEAPFTRPAMSVTFRKAGTLLNGRERDKSVKQWECYYLSGYRKSAKNISVSVMAVKGPELLLAF